MDFQHIVFTFLFIILVLKCCDAGTVTTESFLKARMGFHPINFKCNYTLESHETVHAGDISWQIERIKGSGNFETIAEYSPPDAPIKLNQFAKTPTGSEFKTRSVLPDIVDAGSNTYTAVFRLYEVRCEDEGNFRCLVVFSSSTGTHNVTSESSLLVTAPAEKPYRAPQPEPDNIEEGMTVKFSCTANVGKPPGNIKWWRFKQGQSVPNFMGESNTTPLMQTDVCVYNLTSSISALTMSRDDDRSVWRCSVNNNLLTAYPDYEKPHEDSKRIRVYYSVSTPSIEITPNYAKYQVGSNITIYCSADGNPSPLIDNHINYYIWTFKTRGKANDVILTSNNGLLALQNIREENSGRYTCTAHNGFNGKNFNSSNHVEINVHSGRVSTIPILMAGSGRNTVTFECNYTLENNDVVYPGSVTWKLEKNPGSGIYESIASFIPPGFSGKNSFTNTVAGHDFENRSELLNVTTIGTKTFYVGMRVNELECKDEKNYRCQINFQNPVTGTSSVISVSTLVYRSPAARPYEIPKVVPTETEEGMSCNFSCSANIGNPPGKIKWWRFRSGISQPDLMNESSVPAAHPGVCVYNVTSTVEHTMTPEDDQSVWRCAVDSNSSINNNLFQESPRINVFYRVRTPTITKEPDHSEYSIGSLVTLNCAAQGNPRPNGNINDTINKYIWNFRGRNSENVTEMSTVNGTFILGRLQKDDFGIYECVAFNGFNGKSFNASQKVDIRIGQPKSSATNEVVVICVSVFSFLFVVLMLILFLNRNRLKWICRCSRTSPE